MGGEKSEISGWGGKKKGRENRSLESMGNLEATKYTPGVLRVEGS